MTVAQLWHDVILPGWLSLASAPFVIGGYWLLGERRRAGWLCVIAAQLGLLAIGIADRQIGLVVVIVLIVQAAQNWRRWGAESAAVSAAAQVAA